MNGCFFITLPLAAYIAAACYCDIRYKAIFNRLNIIFFIIALAVQYFTGGLYGLSTAIAGMLAGFIVLIIPYRKEWACGGDVKFILTVGAFVGPSRIFFSTLYGLVILGITTIIYLLIRKKLGQLFASAVICTYGCKNVDAKKRQEIAERLPLSVFFGLGALLYWLYTALILS
ncbi:MAG: hypothetical protein GXZ07_07400 [Firmicutes bacterium]|nr:hypothetical protein [Bacillota bacterium]